MYVGVAHSESIGQRTTLESIFSFHLYMGPRGELWSSGLLSKYLYPLSHLTWRILNLFVASLFVCLFSLAYYLQDSSMHDVMHFVYQALFWAASTFLDTVNSAVVNMNVCVFFLNF